MPKFLALAALCLILSGASIAYAHDQSARLYDATHHTFSCDGATLTFEGDATAARQFAVKHCDGFAFGPNA